MYILKESTNIRLRETKEIDLEFVLETEMDSGNNQFIVSCSKKQHIEAINNEAMLHLIIETDDQTAVGYMILSGLNNVNGSVELVRIVIKVKKKGYGKESLSLIRDYVFDTLNAHRLWLDVKEHNYRARELYELLGFKKEGFLRECIKTEEGYESLIIMAILETEYKNLHKVEQSI